MYILSFLAHENSCATRQQQDAEMVADSDDQKDANDSGWFVFFVSSILVLAIVMGIGIVRLNAELDQAREGRVTVGVGCLNRPLIVSNNPTTNVYARCKSRAGDIGDDNGGENGLVADEPQTLKTNNRDD
ncbi:hypothetical protein [Pseudomonas sp. 6D_7.1_Bac1]|uniref:hypothetical protein n=1 Tax=Pseudomonas sp. 6D_7.1_Bac1 TaxID=2971615 RepID=UPI0021CA5F4D|nr:hypothetical protein [Pseudomonas sp. 6D_7.1_Bac1]MCU1751953.1 hypothetical protein [Pseudomonas sp. 6D_7.1_Bac1]